jgi:hypothetical protein
MARAISLTVQILQQPGTNPETIGTVALASAVVPRTANLERSKLTVAAKAPNSLYYRC